MFALVLCVFFVLCSAALGLAMKIVSDHESAHRRIAYPYTRRTSSSVPGTADPAADRAS